MMYLAHIAVSLELLVIAAGFVLLHMAAKERSSHLRLAAWILLIGGVVGLGCNLYYSATYWHDGFFSATMIRQHMGMMSGQGTSASPTQ